MKIRKVDSQILKAILEIKDSHLDLEFKLLDNKWLIINGRDDKILLW